MMDDPRDLSSFLRPILLPNPSLAHRSALFPPTFSHHSSIREYKELVSVPIPVFPPLSSDLWLHFWKQRIPLPARTIWYRILHRKIPTRSFLHNINPAQFPSPHCPRCLAHDTTAVESLSHFFFTCPCLLSVWITIFSSYVSPLITIPQLEVFLNQLLLFQGSNTSLTPLFACGLQAIWSSHWRLIFDDKPFLPQAVGNTALKIHSKLQAELSIT